MAGYLGPDPTYGSGDETALNLVHPAIPILRAIVGRLHGMYPGVTPPPLAAYQQPAIQPHLLPRQAPLVNPQAHVLAVLGALSRPSLPRHYGPY